MKFARFTAFLMVMVGGICPGVRASTAPEVTIPTYYDGRKCAVVFSMDDYASYNYPAFMQAIDACASNHVVASVAVITSRNNATSWSYIQNRIDMGEAVAVDHSFRHIAYQSFTNMTEAAALIPDDITRSITNLTANLSLPSWQNYKGKAYINTWVQPWGTAKLSDGTVIQDYVRDILSTNLFLSDTIYDGGDKNMG